MKYLVILLTALTFSTSDVLAQKFGHVDSQLLLDTMPETAVAQKELEKRNLEFETALTEQKAELDALLADIQIIQNSPDVSEFVLNTKISKYQDDEQRLQQTYQVAQQELSNMEKDLLTPIIEKARQAIKDVGAENGFTYIFDLQGGGIMYEGGGENVLPLVLSKL